jgi:hypothetical protein
VVIYNKQEDGLWQEEADVYVFFLGIFFFLIHIMCVCVCVCRRGSVRERDGQRESKSVCD